MDTKLNYSKELSDKVTGAFVGQIETRPVPSSYTFGLLIVTGLMFLIPFIYFGLIAGLVYGLVWYGQQFGAISGSLSGVRGRGSAFFLLMAIAPFIIGGALFIFLVKAIFKPRPKQPPVRKIFRNNEPLLFAFVDKICEMVGSPKPAEIHVDCHVNASASFLGGWKGILGNNLVLTIGLPLVNGLTLKEFAGVIAHEMGHFNQPLAMRLTYFIWTINDYLEHIATDDSVEDSLGNAHEASHAGAAGCVIYMFTILFIFFTRMIMYGLMVLGQAVSCYMMRQMEYDADRREAALVGSAAFESAMRKLPVLAAAESMSYRDIGMAFSEGRLADDLPALIASNMEKIPAPIRTKIQDEQTRATGVFDTHPSDRDRVMEVRNLRFSPKFLVELPANIVLKNFESLSRIATTDMYLQVLGNKFRPEMLKSSAKVAEVVKTEESGEEIMGRVLQAIIPPHRPLPIPETVLKPTLPRDQQIELINNLRLRAFQGGPMYRKNLKAFLQADIDANNAGLALHLMNSGFTIPPKVLTREFGLAEGTLQDAQRIQSEKSTQKETLEATLGEFEARSGQRLVESLRLWSTLEFAQKFDPKSERSKEVADLLPVLQHVSELMPEVHLLDTWHLAMVNTLNSLPEGVRTRSIEQAAAAAAFAASQAQTGTKVYGNQHQLQTIAESMCASTQEQLVVLHEKMADVLYPFDHERGQVTFRQLLIPAIPAKDVPLKINQVCNATINTMYETYDRLLRRLCVLAHEAEKAAGMQPMDVVKAEDCLPIKKEVEFKVL